MKIEVRGYLTFKASIGSQQLQFDEGERITLYDLLVRWSNDQGDAFRDTLFDPETKNVNPSVAVLVNGLHYSHLPGQLDTQLKDQDQIAIFPPIAGG